MDGLEYSILRVLAYFDVFHYPLLKNEINYFLDQHLPSEALDPVLDQLIAAGIIYNIDGFYTLHNDAGLIHKRIDENKRAALLLPKARKVSNLLYYFPFVRVIGISGSLSKNVADPDADFDYFVITQAGRLWITRTILILLRRCSMLVGKQEWLCMNYFIDESCLQIQEQNIYTATEILTLILTKNNPTSHSFLEANNWVNRYFPNYLHKKLALQEAGSTNLVKKALEAMLNLAFFNQVENWLMQLTVSRLTKRKKAGKLVTPKGKELLLPLSDKHYCKHNPEYLQADVLKAHAEKLDTLIKRYDAVTPLIKASSVGL
jgi:hypothetical protein